MVADATAAGVEVIDDSHGDFTSSDDLETIVNGGRPSVAR